MTLQDVSVHSTNQLTKFTDCSWRAPTQNTTNCHIYMSTAVPADALCYVIQCHHYTPKGLSLTGGLYYFCILPNLSITSGQNQNRIRSVNGKEISTHMIFWNIRMKCLHHIKYYSLFFCLFLLVTLGK